jgi:hypothetical protein
MDEARNTSGEVRTRLGHSPIPSAREEV